MIHRRTLAAAITPAHIVAHVLYAYQHSHAHCFVPLTRSTVSGTRIETTVLCPGLDSALYIHSPPVFQVELEKDCWECVDMLWCQGAQNNRLSTIQP